MSGLIFGELTVGDKLFFVPDFTTNKIMFKEQDRVRFIDTEKDKQFGVLIIFNIKGDIATLGNGDYANLGQNMCNAKLFQNSKAKTLLTHSVTNWR